MNKSQKQNIFLTFSWPQMHLLAHFGLYTNQNDRFPDPFIYFEQQVKFLPFHIRKPFQTEPPRIGHYRKFSPTPEMEVDLSIVHACTLDMSWLQSSHIQKAQVLLTTPTKYRKFFPPLFVKTNNFQLVVNFEQTHTVTIFGDHGIMAYILLWLSQSELQNCIIQWFSF